MLGRTAVLLGLTLSIATFFGVAIIIGSRPDQPAKFLLALLLTAIVSAPVGSSPRSYPASWRAA